MTVCVRLIQSQRHLFLAHAVGVHDPQLHAVARVNVALRRRREAILDQLDRRRLAQRRRARHRGQHQRRNRLELIIQHRHDQRLSRTLTGIIRPFVRAHGVVRKHRPFPFRVQPRDDVKRVIRKKPSVVQRITQHLSERHASDRLLILKLVLLASRLERLLQRLRVRHEPRARHERLRAHLIHLFVISRQDAVSRAHPRVARAYHIIFARHREHRPAVVVLSSASSSASSVIAILPSSPSMRSDDRIDVIASSFIHRLARARESDAGSTLGGTFSR